MNRSIATEDKFAGKGGLKIAYKAWSAVGAPRGVLVLVPGLNSHSGYYGWVASKVAADGLAVHAVDLRGRGKSDGERYYVDSFSDYADDVDRLRARSADTTTAKSWRTSPVMDCPPKLARPCGH
jgi:acylglycerol lipase